MGTGYGPSFGATRGRAFAGDASFMGAHDAFLKAIQKRRDIDPGGKYDVIAHGTATKIEIIHNNKKIYVNSRTAAKLIRHMDGYKKGQPIRLLSCDTGYLNNGFAQNLANKLGVTVYAPTKKLWARSDGSHFIAGSKPGGKEPDMSDRGSFKAFHPNGRSKK